MFLQGSYFILNSHRQCMRVQCLHILTNTWSDFLILAIFVGMKWQVIMVLIYIFLRTDVEKAVAPHSSTLAWKLPWTEEPGGLQSMGSLRVGHDWATSLSLFTFMPFLTLCGCEMASHYGFDLHFPKDWCGEGSGNPLQCSCLENPRDGGACWAAVYGVAQSWTRLKWLSGSSKDWWFEHFFKCFGLSVYILWRDVCPYPLPILKLCSGAKAIYWRKNSIFNK